MCILGQKYLQHVEKGVATIGILGGLVSASCQGIVLTNISMEEKGKNSPKGLVGLVE